MKYSELSYRWCKTRFLRYLQGLMTQI